MRIPNGQRQCTRARTQECYLESYSAFAYNRGHRRRRRHPNLDSIQNIFSKSPNGERGEDGESGDVGEFVVKDVENDVDEVPPDSPGT